MHGDNHLARQKYEDSIAGCRQTGEIIRQNMLFLTLSMSNYNEEETSKSLDLGMVCLK